MNLQRTIIFFLSFSYFFHSKPHFEFTADALTDGTLPVTVCGFCKNEGHTRDECPDEVQRLEIPPLPPLSNKQRMVLDSVCNYVFSKLNE